MRRWTISEHKPFLVVQPGDGIAGKVQGPASYGEVIIGGEQGPTEQAYLSHYVLCPGQTLEVHYHSLEEVQYILFGHGLVTAASGEQHRVGPGSVVYCGSGPDGGHGFTNPGNVPLVILCFFPSKGGVTPDRFPL